MPHGLTALQEEANSWHLLSKIHSAAGVAWQRLTHPRAEGLGCWVAQDLAEAVQCVANTRTLCQQLKEHSRVV